MPATKRKGSVLQYTRLTCTPYPLPSELLPRLPQAGGHDGHGRHRVGRILAGEHSTVPGPLAAVGLAGCCHSRVLCRRAAHPELHIKLTQFTSRCLLPQNLQIYNLPVTVVPPNRTVSRTDNPDVMFRCAAATAVPATAGWRACCRFMPFLSHAAWAVGVAAAPSIARSARVPAFVGRCRLILPHTCPASRHCQERERQVEGGGAGDQAHAQDGAARAGEPSVGLQQLHTLLPG